MPPQEEMTAVAVDDGWIESMFAPFVRTLWMMPDSPERRVLLTAISWQGEANSAFGLGRYLHFFASVELLAHHFYNELPAEMTGRRSDTNIRKAILEQLLDLKSGNYMVAIGKCSELLEASARTKMKVLGKIVNGHGRVFRSHSARRQELG